MSTLTGRTVATTYKDLLQISNQNSGIDGQYRYIEDGEGTISVLGLSTDGIQINGHVQPAATETFDLGSDINRFRDLYLSGNTIYLGDKTITSDDVQAVKDVQTTSVPVSSIAQLASTSVQPNDPISFSVLINKPTTLAGYDITDAATAADLLEANDAIDNFLVPLYTDVKIASVSADWNDTHTIVSNNSGDWFSPPELTNLLQTSSGTWNNATQPDTDVQFNNLTVTGELHGSEQLIIDPAAVGDNTGRVIIKGDLQVDGVTTTVNSTTMTVSGKTVTLAQGATEPSMTDQTGIHVDHVDANILYDSGTDTWNTNRDFKVQGDSVVTQSDIGLEPNQIPLHKDLGTLAYQDTLNLSEVSVDRLTVSSVQSVLHNDNYNPSEIVIYDTSLDSDGGAWRYRCKHTSWYNESLNTSTRGSRREFPVVAVIVKDGRKRVTIFDGDDPDLPMWMVFQGPSELTDGENQLRNMMYGCGTFRGLAMRNAQLCTGSQDTNFWSVLIDFIRDDAIGFHGVAGNPSGHSYLSYNGDLSTRNDASPYHWNPGDGVRNNKVNSWGFKGQHQYRYVDSVAITTEPDAPIDPVTGLARNTFAFAHQGWGLSVITKDGSIVNQQENNNADPIGRFPEVVSFNDQHDLVVGRATYSEANRYHHIYSREQFSYLDSVPSSRAYVYMPDGTTDTGGSHEVPLSNSPVEIASDTKHTAVMTANPNQFFMYNNNASVPRDGHLARITDTQNSGWMQGETKMAVMCTRTDPTHDEYVGTDSTNIFDDWNDPAVWARQGNIMIETNAVDSSKLDIRNQDGTGSNVYFYKRITVEPNTVYELELGIETHHIIDFFVNLDAATTLDKLCDINISSNENGVFMFRTPDTSNPKFEKDGQGLGYVYLQGYQQNQTPTTINTLNIRKSNNVLRSGPGFRLSHDGSNINHFHDKLDAWIGNADTTEGGFLPSWNSSDTPTQCTVTQAGTDSIRIDSPSGHYGAIWQRVTLKQNTWYTFTMELESHSGSTVKYIRVGYGTGAGSTDFGKPSANIIYGSGDGSGLNIQTSDMDDDGHYRITRTFRTSDIVEGTQYYVIVGARDDMTSMTVRNIQLHEVENYNIANRASSTYVIANQPEIVGQLKRTSAMPGSEVPAYSGFGTRNFIRCKNLQPPGLGDFSMTCWVKPDTSQGYFHLLAMGGPDSYHFVTDASDSVQYAPGAFTIKMYKGYDSNWPGSDYGATVYISSADGSLQALRDMMGVTTNANYYLPRIEYSTWQQLVVGRKGGSWKIYVNGNLLVDGVGLPNELDVTNGFATIGCATGMPEEGGDTQLSLWRYANSFPSDEQILRAYRDESMLFKPGAAATLNGTGYDDLHVSYDRYLDQMHLCTRGGTHDVFQDLCRIHTEQNATTHGVVDSNNGLVVWA